MKTLGKVLLLSSLMASASSAQEPAREWPSQSVIGETQDRGDDPAMGGSGRCRHQGERVAQGNTICLDVNGERYNALCGMELNNTSWLRQPGSC